MLSLYICVCVIVLWICLNKRLTCDRNVEKLRAHLKTLWTQTKGFQCMSRNLNRSELEILYRVSKRIVVYFYNIYIYSYPSFTHSFIHSFILISDSCLFTFFPSGSRWIFISKIFQCEHCGTISTLCSAHVYLYCVLALHGNLPHHK